MLDGELHVELVDGNSGKLTDKFHLNFKLSPDDGIEVTLGASLKVAFNNSGEFSEAGIKIPKGTILKGSNKIYKATYIEENEVTSGLKAITTGEVELEYDKIINPTKIVSLKNTSKMELIYEGTVSSVSNIMWKLVDIPLSKSELITINGSKVCNHINYLVMDSQDLYTGFELKSSNFKCDEKSILQLTIK